MQYFLIPKLLWLLAGAGAGVLGGWWLWGRHYAAERQRRIDENGFLRESFNETNEELKSCRAKLAVAETEALSKPTIPQVEAEPAPAPTANAKVKPEVKAEPTEAPQAKQAPAPAEPKSAPKTAEPPASAAEPVTPETLVEGEAAPDSWKPELLTEAQGEKDDLKRIKGIGPKIEGILNDLGVYHISQIAEFTEENVAWVNSHLRFKGRIQREKWIEQAKEMVAKG